MNEDTNIIRTEPINGSRIASVSVRGWLALMAILTVCVCTVMEITVGEPLYTLAVAIVAFYYGQTKKT